MRNKGSYYDPFTETLRHLNQAAVQYVVVGVSGINFHAEKSSEIFLSLDYDIFVDPTRDNLKKIVRVLKGLDFSLIVNEKEFAGTDLEEFIKDKRTLLAVNPEGVSVELRLKISGFTFFEMRHDAVLFKVKGVTIPVGRIDKLLASKRIADRPKDRLFLKRFSLLKDETSG